jgi:hypothetical protein
MHSAFLETVVGFVGVSLTLYAIGHLYTWMTHDQVIKQTVRCKYCRKYISEKVFTSVSIWDIRILMCFRHCAASTVPAGRTVARNRLNSRLVCGGDLTICRVHRANRLNIFCHILCQLLLISFSLLIDLCRRLLYWRSRLHTNIKDI